MPFPNFKKQAPLIVASMLLVIIAGLLMIAGLTLFTPETPFTVAVLDGPEGLALENAASDYFKGKRVPYRLEKLDYDNLWKHECSELLHPGKHIDDVILVDEPWLALYATRDKLRKIGLNAEDKNDFFGPPLSVAYQVDPKGLAAAKMNEPSQVFAVPFVDNAQVLAFNSNLLNRSKLLSKLRDTKKVHDTKEADGVSWEDLLKEWGSISKAEIPYGFLVRGNSRNPLLTDFMPVIRQVSPKSLPVDFTTKRPPDPALPPSQSLTHAASAQLPPLLAPNAGNAIDVLLQLESLSPKSFMSFGDFELANYLLFGQVAYAVLWSYQVLGIKDLPRETPWKASWALAMVPGGQPESGSWLLAVPKNSRRSSEAIKFVESETSTRALVDRALDSKTTPPRRSSLHESLHELGFGPQSLSKRHLDPKLGEMLELALDSARPRPLEPAWEWFRRIIQQELTAVSLGLEKPKDAVKHINERVNDAQDRFQKVLETPDACRIPADLESRLPPDTLSVPHQLRTPAEIDP